MIRDDLDVVARSMVGEHPIDDETQKAVGSLADRLRRVRNLGGAFAGVEFSGYVSALRQQCRAVAVG
jgi:hypothetical protein